MVRRESHATQDFAAAIKDAAIIGAFTGPGGAISLAGSRAADALTINAPASGSYTLTNGDFTVNSPSWGRDGWLYFCASPPSANFDVWRVRPAMGTGQP